MLMINLQDFVNNGLSVAQVTAIRQEIAALQYALHLNERISKPNGRPRKPPAKAKASKASAPTQPTTATTNEAHATELSQEPAAEVDRKPFSFSRNTDPPTTKPRWPDWDKISVGNVGDEERRVPTKANQSDADSAGSVGSISNKLTMNFRCNQCGNRRYYDNHIPTVCPFCGSQDVCLGTNKGKEISKEGRGKDAKEQVDAGGIE